MAGTTFTINVAGMDKLKEAFAKAPTIIEPIMQQAISKSAAVLASHTDPSNVPWVTGNLARSFNPVEIGRLFARWFPRAEYAKSVQFGMPPSPGRYVPAIKKRLKNGDNIGMWPGFKGRHFMEKIRADSVREITEIFHNALKVVVGEIKSKI